MTAGTGDAWRPFCGGANVHTINEFRSPEGENAGSLSAEEERRLLEITVEVQKQGEEILSQGADNLQMMHELCENLETNDQLLDRVTYKIQKGQADANRVFKTMTVAMFFLAFLVLCLFLFKVVL